MTKKQSTRARGRAPNTVEAPLRRRLRGIARELFHAKRAQERISDELAQWAMRLEQAIAKLEHIGRGK